MAEGPLWGEPDEVSGAGGADEMRECEPWDRCWCVLELAIRYFAEKQVPNRGIQQHCTSSGSRSSVFLFL